MILEPFVLPGTVTKDRWKKSSAFCAVTEKI